MLSTRPGPLSDRSFWLFFPPVPIREPLRKIAHEIAPILDAEIGAPHCTFPEGLGLPACSPLHRRRPSQRPHNCCLKMTLEFVADPSCLRITSVIRVVCASLTSLEEPVEMPVESLLYGVAFSQLPNSTIRLHLSKAIRGVRVSGLRMVDRKTTLVTNAGST